MRDSWESIARAETTQVVVVGARPTGLTAATRLAQLGVRHVVLDAAAEPTRTSKAALVHASTLELLAELGAAAELVVAGRKARRIVMHDRGRVLIAIDLTDVPSRYPFALGSLRVRPSGSCCGGWRPSMRCSISSASRSRLPELPGSFPSSI
jgi:choline dehydrogenase-like flavoprotein